MKLHIDTVIYIYCTYDLCTWLFNPCMKALNQHPTPCDFPHPCLGQISVHVIRYKQFSKSVYETIHEPITPCD